MRADHLEQTTKQEKKEADTRVSTTGNESPQGAPIQEEPPGTPTGRDPYGANGRGNATLRRMWLRRPSTDDIKRRGPCYPGGGNQESRTGLSGLFQLNRVEAVVWGISGAR